MKILIIEDEPQAALRLEKLLKATEEGAVVLASIDSVKNAVLWFRQNPPPDVVLMDIQLADGISFSIFEQCEVKAPVIFTTAYDEYALKAFSVDSIDYLLKPVDRHALETALQKLKARRLPEADARHLLLHMNEAVRRLAKKYKARFVIKVGEHLKTVAVEDVLYFFSKDKTTFCATRGNRSLILDYTLEQLEEMLDPALFFRINRKYLVRATAITDIISYTNSRLRLVLQHSQDKEIIVARERVQEFREWLDQ